MPSPAPYPTDPRAVRTIAVNGETQRVEAATLAALLAELGFAGAWLGTAVNGTLVARAEREAHPIHEGDRIEVLSPMQGG